MATAKQLSSSLRISITEILGVRTKKMSRRPIGDSQSKNQTRGSIIPQKLRHFFASFPDSSFEFPTLPDWLLRRPMGSICVYPKSPQPQREHSVGGSRTSRRNKIEPLSNAQFIPRRKSSSSKRISNLTYKNTWSSFLKTSQSDQVKFVPIKPPSPMSIAPLSRHLSVRFNHRRSWDDSIMSEVPRPCDYSQRSLSKSSSPVRRRPSSMRTDSRKYLKQESKVMREAWLNENVFPQYGIYSASSDAAIEEKAANHSKTSSYTLHEFTNSCPHLLRNHSGRRRSEKSTKRTAVKESYLTPGSLEISGASTLGTTSASVNVNATSTTSSPFISCITSDSAQTHFPPRSNIRTLSDNEYRCRYDSDSLGNTTTSQSVEVQVSSMTTQSSNTSMQPNMSSCSSSSIWNQPAVFTNDVMSARAVARDVLKKERAISSANSRKSCLKESITSSMKNHAPIFKDPFRLEWTKRYLYTLAPPIPKNVYHDRSSSMSRVSSYDMRDFQVYTVQRPWQSNPDLRMEKWKPVTTCGSTLTPSSANESLEIVDVVKKKKLMAQLFQEREAEEHSYRALKREIRSMTLPRSLSAGRSRHFEPYLVGMDEISKSKNEGKIITGNSKDYKRDVKPTHASFLAEFHRAKSPVIPFKNRSLKSSSTDNLSFGVEAAPSSPRQTIRKKTAQSCKNRPRSSVKFNSLQMLNNPLQPASGENKASALRRSLTKKKSEEKFVQNWQQQQRERERKNRLRALRLDPAWVQVRGGEQALEDIAHRRCYKEVVERERLLQYYMDKEEMLNRVWQMPPLFERQAMIVTKVNQREIQACNPNLSTSLSTEKIPTYSVKFNKPDPSSMKTSRPCPFTTDSTKSEENPTCYLASESLQLSRPNSTAKNSTKSISAFKQ